MGFNSGLKGLNPSYFGHYRSEQVMKKSDLSVLICVIVNVSCSRIHFDIILSWQLFLNISSNLHYLKYELKKNNPNLLITILTYYKM
jgi:hypothetical protein